MNIKQTLIIIFFMMFLVNFIPRANASLVELEFSNGATVSFDDTVSEEYTQGAGTDWEGQVRRHHTVLPSVDHPDNVVTGVTTLSILSIEGLGVNARDVFEMFAVNNIQGSQQYKSNYILTKPSFVHASSGISTSLVDAIGLDNLFEFRGYAQDITGSITFQLTENITLTSVKLDGVSQTSPVPVPGAVWLFGTAISGLVARKKLGVQHD